MDIGLHGRTALVTGSASGIGFAIAAAMHQAGAIVIVHGRTPESVNAAIDRLGGGKYLHGVPADLGTPEGCATVIGMAADVGPVDILVNNAGTIAEQHLYTTPVEQWERMLNVNAWSGLRLAQALVPAMVDRDDDGRLIWVSSAAALTPRPNATPYGISKLVQVGLSRAFAEAVAGTTVTSNVVLPGPTATEGAARFLTDVIDSDLDQAWIKFMQLNQGSLLQRAARPEEIAPLVVFLASPYSSAIRGAALRVEGGVLRSVI